MPIIRVAAFGPASRALRAARSEITRQLATNAVLWVSLDRCGPDSYVCESDHDDVGGALPSGSNTHNL